MTIIDKRGRPLLGFVALITVPLLILTDLAVAMSRGWRISSRLDMLVAASAVLLMLVGSLGLVVPGGRSWIGRRAWHLVLFVGTASLSWVLAESALVLLFGAVDHHLRRPGLTLVYDPKPGVMPGITGTSTYTTNSRGIRGPELPPEDNVYRILCIGGSTTECGYLDDIETWPHLLSLRLNAETAMPRVWIGNIGISGYASEDHLRFIRTSSLMREIDCLVVMAGINDLQRYLQGGPGRDFVTGPVWRRSAILEQIRAVWHRNPGIEHEDAAGEAYEMRRQKRQSGVIVDQLPDMTRALSSYHDRIREMILECRAKDVLPIFATQPVLWDEHLSSTAKSLLWLGWMTDGRYVSAGMLRSGMERFNDEVRKTCEDLGVPCVDLAGIHGKEALFYDDAHYTEEGAREVARLISDWFLAHRRGGRWGES